MDLPFCVWRNSITSEQKKPNWKPLIHLLRLEASFSCRSALRAERWEGGGAELTGGILQQMSTSLRGRAIKGKVLKAGDVRHVTQSTRNRVSLLTHQHGTNFYCVLRLVWISDCVQRGRRHQDTIRNADNPVVFHITNCETQKPIAQRCSARPDCSYSDSR